MSDYSFAGAGTVPGGEYDNVSVSGSGKGTGDIRCKNFKASGSFGGTYNLYCSEELKVAGAFKCGGNIKAGYVNASGAFKCEKSLNAEKIKISGAVGVGNDIEGDTVNINGSLNCGGLVNAENFNLEHDGFSNIGSIGGSNIQIKSSGSRTTFKLINLFRKNSEFGRVTVEESIEGDVVTLEYVDAPKVVGRVVVIGKGCNIGSVIYSESAEISPDAKVKNCEQDQLMLP